MTELVIEPIFTFLKQKQSNSSLDILSDLEETAQVAISSLIPEK